MYKKVCSLYSAFYPSLRFTLSLQSAVRSLRFTLTAFLAVCSMAFYRGHILVDFIFLGTFTEKYLISRKTEDIYQ